MSELPKKPDFDRGGYLQNFIRQGFSESAARLARQDFMYDEFDYYKARCALVEVTLEKIKHGDDTAPEIMRRTAKEALLAIAESEKQ